MIRLGASGVLAGSAVGLVWRAAGRTRWGAAPFMLAVLAAADFTERIEWPRWQAMVGVGAIVVILSGVGARRILADPATHWAGVAFAALISAAGVWVGVPETGPALLTAGGLLGLVATAALTRARWGPAAGVGVAAVLGWAALTGAAGRPWATVGGALCGGMAPWLALCPPAPRGSRSRSPRLLLLSAHLVMVLLAARWVGVNPSAGWGRVAIVAFAGMAVAMATRRQA